MSLPGLRRFGINMFVFIFCLNVLTVFGNLDIRETGLYYIILYYIILYYIILYYFILYYIILYYIILYYIILRLASF